MDFQWTTYNEYIIYNIIFYYAVCWVYWQHLNEAIKLCFNVLWGKNIFNYFSRHISQSKSMGIMILLIWQLWLFRVLLQKNRFLLMVISLIYPYMLMEDLFFIFVYPLLGWDTIFFFLYVIFLSFRYIVKKKKQTKKEKQMGMGEVILPLPLLHACTVDQDTFSCWHVALLLSDHYYSDKHVPSLTEGEAGVRGGGGWAEINASNELSLQVWVRYW